MSGFGVKVDEESWVHPRTESLGYTVVTVKSAAGDIAASEAFGAVRIWSASECIHT